MSAPQKFLFDNSFDLHAEAIDPLAELREKFEARVEKARTEAFEEGRAAGQKAAQESIENATKAALKTLASQEKKLRQEFMEEAHKLEAKAIEFGIAAGTTLAGELIRREPMALVEDFFRKAFQIIQTVPEVTARIHPSVAPQVQEASAGWMAAAGFDGNIKFIADESLKPADVSIRWQDGGVERSLDDLMAAIHGALTNFLSARDHHFRTSNEPSLMQHKDILSPVPEAPSLTNEAEPATRENSSPVDLIPDDTPPPATPHSPLGETQQPLNHDSETQS